MPDDVGEPREPIEGAEERSARFDSPRPDTELLGYAPTSEEAEARRDELVRRLESREVEPKPEQLVARYDETVEGLFADLQRNFEDRQSSPVRSQLAESLRRLLNGSRPAEDGVFLRQYGEGRFKVGLFPPYNENPLHNEREYRLVRSQEPFGGYDVVGLIYRLRDQGRRATSEPGIQEQPELVATLGRALSNLSELADIFEDSDWLNNEAAKRLYEIMHSLRESLQPADRELHQTLTEAFRRSGDDVMARQRTILEDIEEKLIRQRHEREDKKVRELLRALLEDRKQDSTALDDYTAPLERRFPDDEVR